MVLSGNECPVWLVSGVTVAVQRDQVFQNLVARGGVGWEREEFQTAELSDAKAEISRLLTEAGDGVDLGVECLLIGRFHHLWRDDHIVAENDCLAGVEGGGHRLEVDLVGERQLIELDAKGFNFQFRR